MSETQTDSARVWFERGFMAAYAEAHVAGQTVPLSDEILDKAWDRQAEIVADIGDTGDSNDE